MGGNPASAGFVGASDQGSKPDLNIVDVSAQNIHHLIPLIELQAEFHEQAFTGTQEQLLQDLLDPNATPKAFMVYDSAKTEPVAYVLYYESWDGYGRQTYLEDIYAKPNSQAGGFAFDEIVRRATITRSTKLSWSVMQNNTDTIGFYHHKGATVLPKDNWDLTHLLSSSTGISPAANEQPYNGFEVTEDYAESLLSQHPQLDRDYIDKIMRDPNSTLFAIADRTGQIQAISVVNTAYSSFRTEEGLQIDHFQMLGGSDDEQTQTSIYNAAMSSIIEYAHKTGKNKHLYAYAKHDDVILQCFYKSKGGTLSQMNDDPNSVFQMMGIDLHPSTPYAPSLVTRMVSGAAALMGMRPQ